jgi:hypothetical protein
MDEDVGGGSSAAASFPEATLEEHLRESLKSLQVTQPRSLGDKSAQKPPSGPTTKATSEILARQSSQPPVTALRLDLHFSLPLCSLFFFVPFGFIC